MAPSRFNSARAPCGEGFFHPLGGSGFRHSKDLCVSRSRLPAVSLEDASHSWTADDPSQHLYAFDLAPPKIATRNQRGQEWPASGATMRLMDTHGRPDGPAEPPETRKAPGRSSGGTERSLEAFREHPKSFKKATGSTTSRFERKWKDQEMRNVNGKCCARGRDAD